MNLRNLSYELCLWKGEEVSLKKKKLVFILKITDLFMIRIITKCFLASNGILNSAVKFLVSFHSYLMGH